MIQIRLARAADAAAIADIYRPSIESAATSFETIAPDAEEMASRIRGTLERHPWLVCDIEGVVAGYAYATRHRERAAYRWSVDTSVYVSQAFYRLGVGRGLYASLFDILAAQGYVAAYAGIALPNPASVRLHEGVGFVPVGIYRRVGFKLGKWHDVGWWERPLAPRAALPAEPLSLAEVRARPQWESGLARGESMVRANRGGVRRS